MKVFKFYFNQYFAISGNTLVAFDKIYLIIYKNKVETFDNDFLWAAIYNVDILNKIDQKTWFCCRLPYHRYSHMTEQYIQYLGFNTPSPPCKNLNFSSFTIFAKKKCAF